MNRKRGNLQCYFAGLFDGEGSVGLYFVDRSWRLCLQLRMVESLPVCLLWREYPELSLSRYQDARKPQYRSTYAVVANGNTAYRFLKEIEPYVILKKDEVKLSLAFLAAWRQDVKDNGGKRSDPFKQRASKISEKLKELKRIPNNGVNSVNAWPDKSREYRSELADAEDDVSAILRKLEGVETRHRDLLPVEAISAPEKELVLPRV